MNIEIQKIIDVGHIDRFPKAIIEFLNSEKLYNPEINVINPNPQDYSPEYIFPRDFFLASFSSENIPYENELKECLEQAKYQFSAVAGIDENDMTRIMMTPVDAKTLAMRATCHFTEEEMDMSKNDRRKLESKRKKKAFSIISQVADDIYSSIQ